MKFIVLLFIINMDFSVTDYGQDRSKVVYYNPKYIAQVSTFTSRVSRRHHYHSSICITTKVAMGNNVTMKLLYNKQANKDAFSWKTRVCDMTKYKWIMDFVKEFSNIDTRTCPVKAGKYNFKDIEIGAKFLPLPLPPGKNIVTLLYYITDTEEHILECNIILHN